MLRGLFAGAAGRSEAADRPDGAAVKAMARALLAGLDGVEITVSEISCPDPACPGDETVILVMQPGRRSRAAKIRKPISAVTDGDVWVALSAAGFEVSS